MRFVVVAAIALLLMVCCTTLCQAQVGWEVETRVEASRVNPKSKAIRNFDVRTEIPVTTATAIKKVTPSGETFTKTDLTGAELAAFKTASVWRWTIDGVESCVTSGTVKATQKKKFEDILDSAEYKAWEKRGSYTPIVKGDTYKHFEVQRVNRFSVEANDAIKQQNIEMKRLYDLSVAATDSALGPPPPPPPPSAYRSLFFDKFLWDQVSVIPSINIAAPYQSYSAPTETRDGKTAITHDYGCRGILEFKTAQTSNEPLTFSAQSITDARTHFARLTAANAPLHNDFEGIYEVHVSDEDVWVLSFFAGEKFKADKDLQFTYNERIETLGSVPDLGLDWPAAPLKEHTGARLDAVDINRQRLLLKFVQQSCGMDKNNQQPWLKRTDGSTIGELSKLPAFRDGRTAMLDGKTKATFAEVETKIKRDSIDPFMDECKKPPTACVTERQKQLALERCLMAYFPPKVAKPRDRITMEQRIPCASDICQSILNTMDVNTVYNKYKASLV